MQHRILNFFFVLADRHGRWVMAGATVLTVLAALCIPGLRISTSHSDLVSDKHPEQARYRKFLEEFGAIDNMVVVLEGEPDRMKTAADALADAFAERDELVRSVFYRIDLERLAHYAPLFVDVAGLEAALEALKGEGAWTSRLMQIDNLPALLEFVVFAMRHDQSAFSADPHAAMTALDMLNAFLGAWHACLQRESRQEIDVFQLLAGRADIPDVIRSDGYLMSHQHDMLFLFVQPVSSSDEAAHLKAFRQALIDARDACFAERPELEQGVRTAFTGLPAHVLTEVETIYADVGRAGSISICLVAVILWAGFRSFRKMVVAVVPLCCGMIITLGIIRLAIGHLNLISSSFLAVLFGIGIDFGIYLIRRVEEELGNGRSKREAVRIATTIAGKGVMTGGLTTCLAFYAVTLSDFVGFSELGATAGTGILIVLLTTFCLLPVLLLRVEIEPRVYLADEVNRGFIKRRMERSRHWELWAICAAALGLCLGGLTAAGRLEFDFNALNLLPRNSESTVYQLKMQNESDFQMSFAAVTADTLSQLKALETRITPLPTVRRVESLSALIPENQEEKLNVIDRLAGFFPENAFVFRPSQAKPDPFSAPVEGLYDALADIQELAFSSGKTELVAVLDRSLTILDSISVDLQTEQGVIKSRDFERQIFEYVSQAWRLVDDWRDLDTIDEGDLDPALLGRFKSPAGRYVAYVFPQGSMWDLDFLDQFVAELKDIDAEVTGYPITHRVNTRLAVWGLVEALIFAFGIIIILLFLDFRRISSVILTLMPLTIGMLTVQVAMWALNQDYNYASIAGLPLLLGLGVVYGVHIVHRWLERPGMTAFAAVLTSGRGVAFAAFTTICGLCSIVFARHKGASTFGIILLMGIISCLIAALLVLPAIIDLLRSHKNEGEK